MNYFIGKNDFFQLQTSVQELLNNFMGKKWFLPIANIGARAVNQSANRPNIFFYPLFNNNNLRHTSSIFISKCFVRLSYFQIVCYTESLFCAYLNGQTCCTRVSNEINIRFYEIKKNKDKRLVMVVFFSTLVQMMRSSWFFFSFSRFLSLFLFISFCC